MITEKDYKTLTQHRTRNGKIVKWILYCSPFFFIVMAAINLKYASIFGNLEGYTLSSLFESWIDGLVPQKQYSGIYLKAIGRLEMAVLNIGSTMIMVSIAYYYNFRSKLHDRILATLGKENKK